MFTVLFILLVGNHRISSHGWEMLGNVRKVSLGSVPLAAGWLRLWDAEWVFERPVTGIE